MYLEIGMDPMLKLLREFINQTGFAVCGEAGAGGKRMERLVPGSGPFCCPFKEVISAGG